MGQRYLYIVGFLCLIGCSSYAANVSCNERMRHGPKGIIKGAAAGIGAAVTLYMAGQLKNEIDVLRVPVQHRPEKNDGALQNVLYIALALGSVVYVTQSFAKDSLSSFQIFFDDDEDPYLAVKKVFEEEEAS